MFFFGYQGLFLNFVLAKKFREAKRMKRLFDFLKFFHHFLISSDLFHPNSFVFEPNLKNNNMGGVFPLSFFPVFLILQSKMIQVVEQKRTFLSDQNSGKKRPTKAQLAILDILFFNQISHRFLNLLCLVWARPFTVSQ